MPFGNIFSEVTRVLYILHFGFYTYKTLGWVKDSSSVGAWSV